MADFISNFVGGGISNYPFLMAVVGTIMASSIIFMFYTIVASLFRWK